MAKIWRDHLNFSASAFKNVLRSGQFCELKAERGKYGDFSPFEWKWRHDFLLSIYRHIVYLAILYSGFSIGRHVTAPGSGATCHLPSRATRLPALAGRPQSNVNLLQLSHESATRQSHLFNGRGQQVLRQEGCP